MSENTVEMKSSLSNFIFEDKEIRSVVDASGETWFVLKDVLAVMETSVRTNVARADIEQGLGKGYTDDAPLQTPGGIQQFVVINEPAVTFLVTRSNTDAGRRLNRWIHTEVIPSIRKTGKYELPEGKMIIDTNEYQQLLNDSVIIPRTSYYLSLCVEEYLRFNPNKIRDAIGFALADMARNVKSYHDKVLSDPIAKELDSMVRFLQQPVDEDQKALISLSELQVYFGFQRKSMSQHLLSSGVINEDGSLTPVGLKMGHYIEDDLWLIRDLAVKHFFDYAKTRKYIIKRVREELGMYN